MSGEQPFANNPNDLASLEEELVAYLDGELDAEAARQIELRLASDPAARELLHKLEKTWEMLDVLERAETGDAFTRSTLEMVAAAAEKELADEETIRPKLKRRQWIVGICTLLATALLGYLVGVACWPDPDRRLLEDLPVLENLDQYQEIGQFEFLRLLKQEHLFEQGSENGELD